MLKNLEVKMAKENKVVAALSVKLGNVLREQGKLAEARKFGEAGLATRRKLKDSPEAVSELCGSIKHDFQCVDNRSALQSRTNDAT